MTSYYSFVQKSNPHDSFAIEQERLILEFDAQMQGGLPAQALPALAAAKLTDAGRVMQLTAQGADEVTAAPAAPMHPCTRQPFHAPAM
jgi:hypothetical protein